MKRVTVIALVLLTAAVMLAGAAPATPGGLPRGQTVIAAMLTGRVGTPSNFNEWVGWKNRDRGMQ